MLEIAIKGSKNYWLWIVFLLAVIGAGAVVYIDQFMNGLMITNMSRDVSFGFYIANFTFLVGVAAGGKFDVVQFQRHGRNPLFHRRRVGAEHMQTRPVGNDLDLYFFTLGFIITCHVGGIVERHVHASLVVLIDVDGQLVNFARR